MMPLSPPPSRGGRYFSLLHFLKILYGRGAPDVGGRMDGRKKLEPETLMATVMPREELVRRALKYMSERRLACPELSFDSLLDDASLRFNLSPRDQEALERLFRAEKGGAQA